MKRKAELGIILLLPILILSLLFFNARVMSNHYMILEGFDQAIKNYGEQFSVTKQTFESTHGQTLSINVTVKNTSSFIWPQDGPNPVHMSYHVLDANKKVVIYDALRVDLPNDLRPDQQVTIPLTVKDPELSGNFFIQIDMVQEGMTWFEKKGGETYILRIQEE